MAEPADRLAQGADDQGDGGISDFIDDGGRVGGLECAPAPAHSVGATQRQDMSACIELKAMAIAETDAGTDPFTLGRGLRRKGHVRGPRFLRGDLRAEERRPIGGSLGDLTRIPQCDECLRFSWVVRRPKATKITWYMTKSGWIKYTE